MVQKTEQIYMYLGDRIFLKYRSWACAFSEKVHFRKVRKQKPWVVLGVAIVTSPGLTLMLERLRSLRGTNFLRVSNMSGWRQAIIERLTIEFKLQLIDE